MKKWQDPGGRAVMAWELETPLWKYLLEVKQNSYVI